ncbi:MAG: hypothetical protein MUF22_04285 [Chitinispirillaceae bacterium]|jgi:hypothetical protein|nr:hypothetical protein [Chitinispirillaceae bacterium]
MNIQGLGLIGHSDSRPGAPVKARRARETEAGEEKSPLFQISDTFESQAPQDRSALLDAIRDKIKSGYYKSEQVDEDLSHGFAKILDEIA